MMNWVKRHSLVMFFGIIGLHLFAGYLVDLHSAREVDSRRMAGLERLLENISINSHPQVFLQKVAERIFELLSDGGAPDVESAASRVAESFRIPVEAVEIILFNDSGELISGSSIDADIVTALFRRVCEPWISRKAVTPVEHEIFVRSMKGAVTFDALEDSMGRVVKTSGNAMYTWASWRKIQPASGENLGILVFFHQEFLESAALLRSEIIAQRTLEARISLINRSDEGTILAAGLSSEQMEEMLFRPGLATDRTGLRVFRSHGEGIILTGLLYPTVPVIPFWIQAFGLLLGCVYLNLSSRRHASPAVFSISLNQLFAVLVIGSALVPAALTGLIWRGFESTRTETVKREILSELEENLIQIDSSFSTVFSRRRALYGQWFELMKTDMERMDHWVTEFSALELQAFYDSLLVVSSAGVIIRRMSDASAIIRSIVTLKTREERYNRLAELVEQGLRLRPSEIPFILDYDLESKGKEGFYLFRADHESLSIERLGQFILGESIREFNRRQGLEPLDRTAEMTSMVTSGVMDGELEFIVSRISSSFGGFFEMGLGDKTSFSYIDIIPGKDGRGSYSILVFHNFQTLEYHFWNDIFSRPELWPVGLRLAALTFGRITTSFPKSTMWNRFQGYQRRLVPPRRLISEVVTGSRGRYFIAALACRNPNHYVLVGGLPWSILEARMSALRTRMLHAGLLMSLMVLALVWRLRKGVTVPVAALLGGILAMESGKLNHRISIETKDELEQLGTAFNNTLESMKELEVARFVQEQILPAGSISFSGCEFAGRSIMAGRIGGDYFDCVQTEEGLVFMLGDVSGHSVSAAIVVAMAKTGFNALIRKGITEPGALLGAMNSLFIQHLRKVKMMTCFVGLLREDRTLLFSNAGQAYPLLMEANGNVSELKMVGYPLGVTRKKVFPSRSTSLPTGSTIVLFSDGIIEAVNPAGEQFGYERFSRLLQKTVSGNPSSSSDDFLSHVFSELETFSAGIPWNDDITIARLTIP